MISSTALAGCDRSGDGGDGDAGVDGFVLDDTDTGEEDPYTGWDACVYVFTGWFTKADDCYGSSHWTAQLIAMAEEHCAGSWAEHCDLGAPADPDLAYDCRFAIKAATCEQWEADLWLDDPACQELVSSIGCEFPEQ